MDERKRQVLNAIIKDYIATAEPVGSRAVAKKYALGVSPATIRNEMSDLEELGYLEQPHTSAGRIPSDRGYRYFVDHLMEREVLTDEEINLIHLNLSRRLNEVDTFMRQCCQFISQLTNYTVMMIMPQVGKGKLEKITFIPLNDNQVLLTILTTSGLVSSRLLQLPVSVDAKSLKILEDLLQQKLGGKEMKELNVTLLREVSNLMSRQKQLVEQVLELMDQALSPQEDERVFTGGALNMLSQPEFRDIDKLKNIFGLLEEDDKIKQLLMQKTRQRGTSVAIGQELPGGKMKDCSIVVSSYQVLGGMTATIGVLGPTRMLYPKTIPLMEFITSELTDLFGRK